MDGQSVGNYRCRYYFGNDLRRKAVFSTHLCRWRSHLSRTYGSPPFPGSTSKMSEGRFTILLAALRWTDEQLSLLHFIRYVIGVSSGTCVSYAYKSQGKGLAVSTPCAGSVPPRRVLTAPHARPTPPFHLSSGSVSGASSVVSRRGWARDVPPAQPPLFQDAPLLCYFHQHSF